MSYRRNFMVVGTPFLFFFFYFLFFMFNDFFFKTILPLFNHLIKHFELVNRLII